MIVLSDALVVARLAEIDVRAVSDVEMIAEWRVYHPHGNWHMYPKHRIIAAAWVGIHDDMHLDILKAAVRAKPPLSRVRLAGAVVELMLELITAVHPNPRQLPPEQRRRLQIVVMDVPGKPPLLIHQSPAPAHLLGACRFALISAAGAP